MRRSLFGLVVGLGLVALAGCQGEIGGIPFKLSPTPREEPKTVPPGGTQPNTPPMPQPDNPGEECTFRGHPMKWYDVDGDGWPDWVWSPERKQWIPMIWPNGHPDTPGPMSRPPSTTPGGSTHLEGSDFCHEIVFDSNFRTAMEVSTANLFSDKEAKPPQPGLSAQQLLYLHQVNVDQAGIYTTTADGSWTLDGPSPDQTYADIRLHLPSTVAVYPPAFFGNHTSATDYLKSEIYEVPGVGGTPGYVSVRVAGTMDWVASYLVQSGIYHLNIREHGGASRDLKVDDVTGEIYFDGVPLGPAPEGKPWGR